MATSVKTPPKTFSRNNGPTRYPRKEDARHRRIANGLHNSGRCQTEAPHDKDDAEHDTPHQTTRMQNIRPDDRTDTAPPGIEPDQSDQESRIDCERHAERVEHQHLQHGADDINFQCRGEHFGYEKEPGPRKVGRHTETSVEIFVQGDYLQPVEKRNQHEGDHHLPDGKTQHHLQVGERIGRNRPRHRHESYARHRRPDHCQSRHIPGILPVTGKKPVFDTRLPAIPATTKSIAIYPSTVSSTAVGVIVNRKFSENE